MERTTRSLVAAMTVLACGLLLPPATAAQAPGFEASGQIGAVVPLAEFVEAGDGIPGSSEIGKGLALAGNAGLVFSSGLSVELRGLWAPDPGVRGPAVEGGTGYGALTAGLLQRLRIPVIRKVLVPFAGFGVGARFLSFGDEAIIAGIGERPEGDTSFAGEFFGGVYVTAIPGFRVRLEVRDYLSKVSVTDQSNFQSDLAFLGGLAIGLP